MNRAFILALQHKDDEPLPIYGNIKSQDNFHILIARPTPVGSDNAVCKCSGTLGIPPRTSVCANGIKII